MSRDTGVLRRALTWVASTARTQGPPASSVLQGAAGTLPPSALVASTSTSSSVSLACSWGLVSLRQATTSALSSGAAATAAPTRRGLRHLLNDYKQLSKFKLSSLVVLTSAAGYVAGSGHAIDWAGMGWTALGTFGAAACANTLNQIYEVVNDSKMTRTCNRPLPGGRVSRLHAAAFALTMGAVGLYILHDKTNDLTAVLGAANIFLYAGVYTPLKQMSVANTWVGALVGAIPPLMGWAAASGNLEAGSAVLAAALFSWQMPHFLSLAWLCKDDYIRGGFQMLSRIDPKGRRTAAAALRHCAYLAPIGLLSYLAEVTTWPFAVEAAALSGFLGVYAMRFAAAPGQQTARKLFKMSLLYLPVLLLAMGIHRLPNTHSISWQDLATKLQLHVAPGGDAMGTMGRAMDGVRDLVSGVAQRMDGDSLLYLVKCPSKVQCKDLEGPAAKAGAVDKSPKAEGTSAFGASAVAEPGRS